MWLPPSAMRCCICWGGNEYRQGIGIMDKEIHVLQLTVQGVAKHIINAL